ncbi:alpha-L-fucosidase [Pustulibacterium marinum]|uniref:Alpha-L-fucosidase n=1 Tax=Pustulibacterium marinum TaxID=1224947 RepID=A0A1I7FM72_9FLAO|nr:sialidase family protein [Pustulibacterium marinum]SFU37274.1 alpha-L-fucosidase [Pustulibacterium marinum]
MKRLLLYTILFSFITNFVKAQEEKITLITSEFIYNEAPFPQAHASTVVALSNGNIMASWFGGTEERNPDVSIYTSMLENGKWSVPKKAADGFVNDTLSYPTWNPVLFENSENTLFLFYKIGPSPSTWWGAYKTSTDFGKTWSTEKKFPDGILGPIKNKPIQLKNGRIIAPSSVELDNGAVWHAHMELSDDNGKTWRKILVHPEAEYKVIQPTIIELKDGTLKAFFRSNADYILTSTSSDHGSSWTNFAKSSLPNPNSGIDAVTLKNGDFLMVYNPLPEGKNWWEGRNKLNLAYSKDGENWTDIYQLENEKEGEFSYPAIIQSENGIIHITYTHNRSHIKYVALKLK